MSEISTEGASFEADKPAEDNEDVKFPPFPDPSDKDFDDDLSEEEKAYYKSRFVDINTIVNVKLHCTACDRHLGCSAKNESRMRTHPMLRTLICQTCHSFYNSGEFDRGEDGSELYCRWCGQGGQVYCCSDCIHVFCAKCIKRNLGIAKIKEIENTDDWKCFKCNPKCLWELRAVCWALLRFCDIRNKILNHTEDPDLKQKYQKAIATDSSECCRHKGRRKEKLDSAKKKEKEKEDAKKNIPKLPPTIQVKKFAAINLDELKIERKAQKRPASPKPKVISPSMYMQKPIPIAPANIMPQIKKIRLPNSMNPVRITYDRKGVNTYNRSPRPRQVFPINVIPPGFNGLQNPFSTIPSIMGDNINLSLETLTQGLDMSAVAAYTNNQGGNAVDGDVVCTPDFPMEPLCEVTEDNDDDVECITPGPVAAPKKNPPPAARALPNMSNDNIVQMTENDVTVNSVTGGLKFRVDPQTLSSKKMYRLPDGRIFAINPNPNMPGGYSATIVSVSDSTGKTSAKSGETFAAKLSAVQVPSPTPSGSKRVVRKPKAKKINRVEKVIEPERRVSDLKAPIEWYRYNLVDAVDALDYSLSRLNKLKKDKTTGHLRTRTVDEIRYLHKSLEQILTTSSKRFLEIRETLNKDFKEYLTKKNESRSSNQGDLTEDDDDVEFLPNAGPEDPIFIDENSTDSVNVNESQDVDLTGVNSSEHNDSTENKDDSDLTNVESILADTNERENVKDSEREPRSPSTSKEDNEDTDAETETQPNNIGEAESNDKPNGEVENNQEDDTVDKTNHDDTNTDKTVVDINNKDDSEKEDEEKTSEEDKNKLNDGEIHDKINGKVDDKEPMDIDNSGQSESEAQSVARDKETDEAEISDTRKSVTDKDTLSNDDANSMDM